ncbi:MAG: T9SS type A sorting domain-containing protein [Saprospiraceae bacterium]|nr:T9SS type A sorting domain-containing protein [Saprospiraceae bacterium]
MIAVLDALIAPAFSMDKDSTIVFVTSSNLTNYFGKVDKYGNITSFKINNSLYDYSSNSLIIRKDSSLYTFFYSYRFITTDTAFNIQHQSKRVFPNTSIGLSPMMIPLNDTTVYVFGKGRPINATYSGLRHFFGVTTFSGQEIHKNIYSTSNDTAIWSGWYYTADTTKQREIYWAGTYNFDIGAIGYSSAASSFILHKINRDFSIKWTKRYGGDAYYELYGLLADDNGGCILYGIRYDYNLVPKHDAYILHVDANGIITSETFVPIPTPDIVVYPNPATDLLYINWQKGQNTEGGRLRLTNIQGQTVIDQYIEAGKDDYRLDVSNMAQGVYLLSLNMEGKGISTRKVLISK